MSKKLDEKDWTQNRYLSEGICPWCRIALFKTAAYVAACKKCDLVWRSRRVAHIFPKVDTEA